MPEPDAIKPGMGAGLFSGKERQSAVAAAVNAAGCGGREEYC